MKFFVPPINHPFTVRGTEIRPDDSPQVYLNKLSRIILNEMSHLAAILTTEGMLVVFNRAVGDAAGSTGEDVIGKPFWETLWWTAAPQMQQDLRVAIARAAQGEIVRYEVEVPRSTNSPEVMTVDFTLHPIRDEQGRVVLLLCEGRDITRRKQQEYEIARQREELTALDEAALRQSEERFRMFADTAPAILWTSDPDGSWSFISRGWSDYTGQPEPAALGFGWLDVVHPDDREFTRSNISELSAKREDFTFDFRLRRSDSHYRWTLTAGRPSFDRAGNFTGFIGSIMDIDDRKQAAHSLALFSAIVDSSDDAIVSKDLNGTIMSWNKGAERLFGYTAHEAIGRSILMIIPHDRVHEERAIIDRLKRGERVEHFDTIRVRKDGSEINISLTISPIKDATGKVVGASKIARNITERVLHERALKEVNVALKRANADLQQFAYSASHDLQEPLRMVASYGQLMQKRFAGQFGEAGNEYLGYIVEGALRMDSLLRDLRIYTHVSTESSVPVESVDANEVLKKTLTNLSVAINESGASISSTALPQLRIHEFELEQVFQNLVGNAIHYRSAAPPQIHVAAEMTDGEWLFSVQDNGIGIDEQFQHQIFDMFKRLHSATDYPGTGMGLAICQRVVERAGGRIWVESEKGKGATFFFTFPFEKVEYDKPAPEGTLPGLTV